MLMTMTLTATAASAMENNDGGDEDDYDDDDYDDNCEHIAGTFSWSDGVTVANAMWSSGSPSGGQQCAALYKDSTTRLVSVDCNAAELYICRSSNPQSACSG